MKYYWMILLALFVMAGCTKNSPAPEKPDLSAIEGKHFYLMQKGYTCLSNTPGNHKVLSWADHLEVQNGQLWQWGDLCDDEASHLQPTAKQLTIPKDKAQRGKIQFQGSEYQFYPEQPELCKESPWCIVSQ